MTKIFKKIKIRQIFEYKKKLQSVCTRPRMYFKMVRLIPRANNDGESVHNKTYEIRIMMKR